MMDSDDDLYSILEISDDSDFGQEVTSTENDDSSSASQTFGRPLHRTTKSSDRAEQDFLHRLSRTNSTRKRLVQYVHAQIELNEFYFHAIDDPERVESVHTIALHNNANRQRYAFSGNLSCKRNTATARELVEVKGLEVLNLIIRNKDAVFVQTKNSAGYDCQYLVLKPRQDYEQIFTDFRWLSTFSEYVVDYLKHATETRQQICLADFQSRFAHQLRKCHTDDQNFNVWYRYCKSPEDFRQYITDATNADFIYRQVKSKNDNVALSHPLWDEIAPQRLREKNDYKKMLAMPTFVTEYVAKCFLPKFPKWEKRKNGRQNLLEILPAMHKALKHQRERSHEVGLGGKSFYDQSKHFKERDGEYVSVAALLLQDASDPKRKSFSVTDTDHLKGKVVIIPQGRNFRFAYVQDLVDDGSRMHVRWLALPRKTICNGRSAGQHSHRPDTFYPAGRELFWLTDDDCDTKRTNRIVAVYQISIHEDHALPGHDLFVHRRYSGKEAAIEELRPADISHCQCFIHGSDHCTRQSRGCGPVHQKNTEELPGRMLSLFSGAGPLDSGIAQAAKGLFRTIFAADCNHAALSSFKANHPHKEGCVFHNTDVNELLKDIYSGTQNFPIIDFLVAGCPCQGFSRLNNDSDSDDARKNCTMLAHTISWVDYLRPPMVLIENVADMDLIGPTGGTSAAGQAVSSLVGMGYQARLTTIRASDYGGSTSRNRLFIIATVPGVPLPRIPDATHGKSELLWQPVTASAATLDLAKIGNDCTFINPAQPHHVPFTRLNRAMLGKVLQTDMIVSKMSKKGKKEKAWGRFEGNQPYPTIVTQMSAQDKWTAPVIHPHQDRMCSLMEFRRFHGIPDDYILVGSRAQQLKQLGNSVAWATATVLGKAFAEA